MKKIISRLLCLVLQLTTLQLNFASSHDLRSELTPLCNGKAMEYIVIDMQTLKPDRKEHESFTRIFPDDVWQQIMCRLSVSESLEFALTCKSAYRLYLTLPIIQLTHSLKPYFIPLFNVMNLHPDIFDGDAPNDVWLPKTISGVLKKIHDHLKSFPKQDPESFIKESVEKMDARITYIASESPYELTGPTDETLFLAHLKDKISVMPKLCHFATFTQNWIFDHEKPEIQEQLSFLQKFTNVAPPVYSFLFKAFMNPKFRWGFQICTFLPLASIWIYFSTLYPSPEKILSITNFSDLLNQNLKTIFFHRSYADFDNWVWTNETSKSPYFYLVQAEGAPPIGGKGNSTDLVRYICDFYHLNHTFCHSILTQHTVPEKIQSICTPSFDNTTLACLSAGPLNTEWGRGKEWFVGVETVNIQQLIKYWSIDFSVLTFFIPIIVFGPQIYTFLYACTLIKLYKTHPLIWGTLSASYILFCFGILYPMIDIFQSSN